MSLRCDPGDTATFGSLISIWSNADWPLLMDPFSERLFEARTYRFYLGQFVAYIKVDQRPFPERFEGAALSREPPLHIISRDLAASKEKRVIQRVFDANRRYFRPDSREEGR
jgi:hypothetical protein